MYNIVSLLFPSREVTFVFYLSRFEINNTPGRIKNTKNQLGKILVHIVNFKILIILRGYTILEDIQHGFQKKIITIYSSNYLNRINS